MMNYDLNFECKGTNIDLTVRKVIMICDCPELIAIESSKDGWFEFSTVSAGIYERPFLVTSEIRGRWFEVTEEELQKIKLQLGLQ